MVQYKDTEWISREPFLRPLLEHEYAVPEYPRRLHGTQLFQLQTSEAFSRLLAIPPQTAARRVHLGGWGTVAGPRRDPC